MSLYYHSIYENFSQKVYHASPQTKGKIKHECIDEGRYSTAKKFLQGMDVYSEKYGLCGKIDIYDKESKSLIERKNKVVKIYDGYKFQLYAQYFCLKEMGYEVKEMFIHSLTDNKRYKIELPAEEELMKFEETIFDMRNFNIGKDKIEKNENKCGMCIYRQLCG
ncbi:type V CRISPR-associated protein Cas4 [Candidatus Falkowbacteria bacterium RBG_13_39_14]|uniref:Type V CRISPR-associated protein Cas4 n=1 Tax=Candidatus Falkowbacteria bacterium RBG_13_39_14 TaxID=1797985 RepID=A0A1F5S2G5_9BACT|nr:MAG: type V CRISPR-associated protein Cas4 [Candidatus Falkowbacteria bacterium RBG_13_39_14]